MRLAIVGCGAVAGLHARSLRAAGVAISSACDSSLETARTFAAEHRIACAVSSIEAALEGVDAAVVASPSALHYGHALSLLERGRHVLVELPPCGTAAESERLAVLATEKQRVLQCAHTSRYLQPYRRVGDWIRSNRLGALRQVHYLRCVVPSRRSWVDDALLHHAAHALDLFLDWFGDLQPVAATGQPPGGPYRDISLAARLPNGAPLTIAVTYSSKLPQLRMTLVGSEHTIVVDGFHAIESDDASLAWRGDAGAVLEQAISDQDVAFLRCCRTGDGGVAWSNSIRMLRCVMAFQELCHP
jgi:2-hydroxy-4-carboxymuconate semialdehyde hemiacetal dehydrogenase